jgi:hypothetical protein
VREVPAPLGKLYNIIYVGRAETAIRDRFIAHCSMPNPDLRLAKQSFSNRSLDFWYAECRVADVAGIEAALIKCLGPSANSISGTSAAIRVVVQNPVSLWR